MKSFVVSARCA